MRIIINARFLSQEITGVQRFAIEITKRLKHLHPECDIHFFAPRNIRQTEPATEIEANRIGFLNGHLWEQIELPLYLKKGDLLINLCNTAPVLHKNKLVVVHDLAFQQKEKWHSLSFRILYNTLIPLLLRTSTKVITVSETIKKEILGKYKIEDNKIDVIFNAVSSEIIEHNKTGESDKYILFVGSMDPRKNLVSLIRAFQSVSDKSIVLKIAGGKSSTFKNIEVSGENSDRIHFLGRVDDNQLKELYQNAVAFIYPSLYEGFGIPILEAMNNNCPVLASDIPVFREIYGNSIGYFDPGDIQSISNAINNLTEHPDTYNQLKENSSVLCKKYSWEKSAEKLYSIITLLANTNK